MDSGYYAACTALMSRAQALDTIANNLANTSTSGYRGQHNVFQAVLANTEGSSPLSQAVNSFGILRGTRLDPGQGTLDRTGNETDLAIEGPGFFVIQTTSGKVYTRNGNFHVSRDNQLVTASGDPVMGENGPVAVVGSPLSISPDGTISADGALAGKLAIAEFPTGTEMNNLGQSYYSASSPPARAAQASHVRQGMLEESNVNAVSSVVELVTVQREAEMMQRILSLLNSDIDKVAVQELPRVSG